MIKLIIIIFSIPIIIIFTKKLSMKTSITINWSPKSIHQPTCSHPPYHPLCHHHHHHHQHHHHHHRHRHPGNFDDENWIFSIKDAATKNPPVGTFDDRQKVLATDNSFRGVKITTMINMMTTLTILMMMMTMLLRIATLCLPSPRTPPSRPSSGSKRGFTDFRQDININMDTNTNIDTNININIDPNVTFDTNMYTGIPVPILIIINQ